MTPSLRFLTAACWFTSLCQAAEPVEVTQLRSQYELAVERATAPHRATYLKQLERLLEKFTKAGKLDEALATKAELDKMRAPAAAPMDPAAERAESVRKWMTGRVWTTGFTDYAFKEDGSGVATWAKGTEAFAWELLPDATVSVTRPTMKLIFRFESDSMANHVDASSAGNQRDLRPK